MRLVLDSSAIAGFVAGAITPGELLVEIDAEQGVALIPYACLVEAAAGLADGFGPWLGILLEHPATVLVAEPADDWAALSGIRAMLGTYEPAAAAYLALTAEVDVLTRHPMLYRGLGPDITLPFTD